MKIGKLTIIATSELDELRENLSIAHSQNLKFQREEERYRRLQDKLAAKDELFTVLHAAYIQFKRMLPTIEYAESMWHGEEQ